MPRENSFSDSDGRSLTPDLEDEVAVTSPISTHSPANYGIGRASAEHRRGRPSLDVLDSTLSAPSLIKTAPPTSPRNENAGTLPSARPTFATPGDRFRATVKKVMAMRKTSSVLARRGIGAEPGIDVRRESAFVNYGHIREKCLIEVADYSSVRSSFGRMTNTEFVKLLADDKASAREPWVKVRWINVGGISWDVVSALAIKYDMHPLALEDVLHQRGHARSKADYYHKHLFLRVLCHSLTNEEEPPTNNYSFHMPRSSSPIPMSDEEDDEDSFDGKVAMGEIHGAYSVDDEKTMYGSASGSRFSTTRGGTLRNTVRRKMGPLDVENGLPRSRTADARAIDKETSTRFRNIQLVRELKKGDRVNVKISPMCIFLFKDGTVISIHKDNKLDFTTPITERLRQRDTGLRTTADPSLLVESLIDLVVDQALEVVEAYQGKILKLEQNVLLKPSMKSVRRLHILQGDLILHKRTLEPIKTMIYGLRRYDVDRVAALLEHHDPSMKIEGYMSHKSKIYLADVHDHMEYILTSLDMFAGISENLINYTFNMSSYEMNEVMRRLTLATIIFLPLTLLTGYFGMNFDNMWSIMHGHSDAVFWYIAIPLMVVVVPIFTWGDIGRMAHYISKRFRQHRVKKNVKANFKKSN
ncbi:CorA metal ion transporter (MIT) family protein [Abortiporus biennis]